MTTSHTEPQSKYLPSQVLLKEPPQPRLCTGCYLVNFQVGLVWPFAMIHCGLNTTSSELVTTQMWFAQVCSWSLSRLSHLRSQAHPTHRWEKCWRSTERSSYWTNRASCNNKVLVNDLPQELDCSCFLFTLSCARQGGTNRGSCGGVRWGMTTALGMGAVWPSKSPLFLVTALLVLWTCLHSEQVKSGWVEHSPGLTHTQHFSSFVFLF